MTRTPSSGKPISCLKREAKVCSQILAPFREMKLQMISIPGNHFPAEIIDHLPSVWPYDLNCHLFDPRRFERLKAGDYFLTAAGKSHRAHERFVDVLLLPGLQIDQVAFVNFKITPIRRGFHFCDVLVAVSFP